MERLQIFRIVEGLKIEFSCIIKEREQFCAKLCRLGVAHVAISFVQALICYT